MYAQGDIDEWITDAPSTRFQARGFLQWAVKNHLAHMVEIPEYQKATATTPLDAELRWAAARQLLNDSGIDTRDRLAGLFTLLYAQPISRIARLTTDHLVVDEHGVRIRFGETLALLPEPVAEILTSHLDNRSVRSVVGRTRDTPWLFPGADGIRHISEAHLSVGLKKRGIYSRPSRHAALLDFATQLPAAVLARLLGISTSAADRWVSGSGGWANYAATLQRRSASTDSQPR